MTENIQNHFSHYGGVFAILARNAKIGQVVRLSLKDETGVVLKKRGIIRELYGDGLTIDSDDGTEYIPGSEITKWELPKAESILAEQSLKETVPTVEKQTGDTNSLEINALDVDIHKQSTSLPLNHNNDETLKSAYLPEPTELKLLFTDKPFITEPDPCFDIPEIDSELRREVDRWRNIYQYAQKIREPARMAQNVAEVVELAKTLDNPALYCLAGCFADIGGLGSQRAKVYYEEAIKFDYQPAAVALATLYIKAADWANASKSLLLAIQLSFDGDKTPLVKKLGQCLFQMQEIKADRLGLLLSSGLEGDALEYAKRLVALVVKNESEAYSAALNGNIDILRKTKIGNDLFPWGNESPSSINKKKETSRPAPNSKESTTSREGYISTYNVDRNSGFIVESSTRQTWFFHKKSIESELLLRGLSDGKVRQNIIFAGSFEAIAGKYPEASRVRILSDGVSRESKGIRRTPLRVRLSGIPRDGSYYAKAKEAEQHDQLEKADKYFLMEISHKSKHFKSAIKDLANLKNRMGKSKEAITLLDKYRDLYDSSELSSLDQMKIQFFVKGQQYHAAAKLLAQIAKKTYLKNKRTEYLRQEAYCYYAAGEFNEAIKKLKALPEDSAVTALLTKINQAIEDGIHGKISEELVDDEPLSSLALGLSAMAKKHLDKCEFKGTDERSRENGQFKKGDYDQITKLLSNIKGRRPRDQAEYLLSLAALCTKVPDLEEHRPMHTYLMWYFARLAEAAMSENIEVDVVRCYCIESLRFHSPSPREKLEDAWALLLGTYLSKNIGPSVLLEKAYDGKYGKPLFGLFKKNPEDWKAFLNDAPYYKLHVPAAFQAIEMHIKESGLPIEVEDKIEEERKRNKSIDNVFRWISKSSFSIDYLRTAQEHLAECCKHVRFSLDGDRLRNVTNIYKQCSEYRLERDFRERETNYLRLDQEIAKTLEEIDKMPTVLSFERLYPTLKSLLNSLRKDFELLEDLSPELELCNVLDTDFYVLDNDGRVSLRLLLESKNEIAPPIEAISLVLEQEGSAPCHSPEPLYGGQRREIELNIKPTKKEINDNAFTIQTVVEYRTRRGEKTKKSRPFSIAVRLGTPDSFEKIPNPYGRYAGGLPVDENDNMFFGRSELIDRIIQYISTGESGQCFVLYGQKRSGKSSVLKQIKKRVSKAVFFVDISAGSFVHAKNLWSSFARFLVDEMKQQLERIKEKVPENWPNLDAVDKNPTEKIREVTRLIKRMHLNIVVAVDEFTYIYEMARDDAETFMRGWKALLEAKAFNAILVGQDTMPRFKQAFPNEFSITHDERLTYLKKAEADSLASQPILFNGKTRYRGRALEKMFDLTAGSPFYLQITCDRLVQHLNDRRAAFITEADIDYVAHILTVGTERLPQERFNALVTAAGKKVDTISEDDLLHLLRRLARASSQNGWCYRNILAEISNSDKALKDLVDREIIVPKGDRVSIRVGLFAKWLRTN